ncbi:MAG: PHP domain-containing protein, partial [Myxococcales bacterium]|nr:PHP domain-containing protein [Myxococcales bacterium]
YILEPGARHLKVSTEIRLGDEQPPSCPPLSACPEDCEHGRAEADDGCLICACSEVLELENYTEPANLFGGILGDAPGDAASVLRAGIIAGDFVFFGNQNDVFAPGPGFDEDAAVQGAANEGRNTFTQPLIYDFVAAAGGDISYGYFTVAQPGEPPPVVNVPLFASAATTFLTAGKSCLLEDGDDGECDAHRAFHFERYFVVGEGDVASVVEEILRVRGTPAGRVEGHVYWEATGEPVENARLFVFDNPDPSRDYADVDAIVAANLERRGDAGIVNAIDADLGLDPIEDGDFHAEMPPGEYLVVARNPDGSATSAPVPLSLSAGATEVITPTLAAPATVRYRVVDQAGTAIPAKITFQSLDDAGRPLTGDGRRRPFFGEARRGNGVRSITLTHDGTGDTEVEPGRYRILVSRGPEYGLHVEDDVVLRSGSVFQLDAVVPREIDTRGFMSVDMHLHSTPSFDSGLPVPERVTAAAAEGVEVAVSTDHDVATLYGPIIGALNLEPFLKGIVGAEITTLEQGHFIGFPLQYDELTVPTHGAHDWVCQSGGEILEGIDGIGDGMEPFTIVAHPRDGFFGYVDQLGVDTFTMNRTPPLLEEDNRVFRVASCDFDGMELISAKRMDLVRTPTASELVDWIRCRDRLDASEDVEELLASCPEAFPSGLPVDCDGKRFAACRDEGRTELAWAFLKRMLARDPVEQGADFVWPLTQAETQPFCDPKVLRDDPLPDYTRDYPCAFRPGQMDDYFRYLERGLTPTQIGSSDTHGGGKEPGSPRTWVRASTDAPDRVDTAELVDNLRAGHAFASYGPFIRATIDEASFGDVASASPGATKELFLDVLTPSWFGVDRVEIYLNGQILRLLTPDEGPEAIEDVRGKVTFTVPDRDSWIVVVAMGLEDDNLMIPIILDVPFGEVQLSRVAADAFARVPIVSELFSAPPTVPDWSHIPPYAVTNPIYLDVDGNGRYDAPLGRPAWCSIPCDPAAADPGCPSGQTCLEPEGLCGVNIQGRCTRRVAAGHGH